MPQAKFIVFVEIPLLLLFLTALIETYIRLKTGLADKARINAIRVVTTCIVTLAAIWGLAIAMAILKHISAITVVCRLVGMTALSLPA